VSCVDYEAVGSQPLFSWFFVGLSSFRRSFVHSGAQCVCLSEQRRGSWQTSCRSATGPPSDGLFRRQAPSGLHSTIRAAIRPVRVFTDRPINLDTPRGPFVRTSSPDSRRFGSPTLRARVTGPFGSYRMSLPSISVRSLLIRRSFDRHAGAAAGFASWRQSVPSRNIAQHRTNNFLASATIACFFRALPRLSRRYTSRAQVL
jgi:hypothetical protein